MDTRSMLEKLFDNHKENKFLKKVDEISSLHTEYYLKQPEVLEEHLNSVDFPPLSGELTLSNYNNHVEQAINSLKEYHSQQPEAVSRDRDRENDQKFINYCLESMPPFPIEKSDSRHWSSSMDKDTEITEEVYLRATSSCCFK